MEQQTSKAMPFATLEEAKGEIPYNMLNDYMFRAVLQSNNKVLCGLIRSLLHLPEEIPLKAEITNPIVLGESVENKEFRLDINVVINDASILNLEMQIANQLNWKNRSISYLCRSFEQLNHGEDYNKIKPVIHIGFLNYTLFPEFPQFYAKYKLMNVDSYMIYSDNIDLRVVDLTHKELATEEDKKYQIDYWAALFKSKTWEEMKAMAEKNEYLNEATQTIFRMSADDLVRKRCQDREDYYSDLRSYQHAIAEKDTKLKEKDVTIAEKDAAIAEKDVAIAEKDATIAENYAMIEELQRKIKKMEQELDKK